MGERLNTEVAIVGAGPVGLTLAALLGKRGVDVVVLDRALEVFPLPRAAHLDHTVLRVLQELGCVEKLLPTLTPNTALVLADENLDPLVKIPATGIGRSGYPASMYFYQPDFDRALEAVASSFPSVRILRGHEAHPDIAAGAGSVTVHCDRLSDGDTVDVSAQWVVACDGASSPVREFWGEGLESLGFDERWLVLDLRLKEGSPPLADYAVQVCNPSRAWVANPVPGGRYRVELRLRDDDDLEQVMGLEYLSDFLTPLLGATEFTVERDAIYTFHGLVAPRWRNGRILLAGDAAHQMPPFLGQGMVAGIRDAHNLAWKLAGAVKGTYSDAVVDTYEAERRPHVESVIRSAIAIGRFVSQTDPESVEARNQALRRGDVTDVPSFRIPDLEPGTLVSETGGVTLPQPAEELRIPTLDDRLGDGFSLISVLPVPGEERERWTTNHRMQVLETADLGTDGGRLAEWLRGRGWSVVVVRPDRYVLAAGDSLDAVHPAVERAALTLGRF